MVDLLARLTKVRPSGDGWSARCPAHNDRRNSLSVGYKNERWLLKCHAGCAWKKILAALDLRTTDRFDAPTDGGGGRPTPLNRRASVQHSTTASMGTAASATTSASTGTTTTSPASTTGGLTLDQYAAAKGLPADFLRSCGISEFSYDQRPTLRIPYLGGGGEELAVRFRIALEGDRFRWKSGSKQCLYGLHRLEDARRVGQVVLVEGESDCHTLWHHGIAAIGVPGAANWREDRDARHLEGIETIYVVIEADRGGEAVRKWLSQSAIRHRVKLLSLPEKDPSAMHVQGPDQFKDRWRIACLAAVPWTAVETEASAAERNEAWSTCADLARRIDIFKEFDSELERLGLVGERRAAKLTYLALVSRLLERPVSVAVKGPSSGGKSFMVETVLKFFPPHAFYSLTAMSEHALAYSTEPLRHRHLVIYEAAGMKSDFATYLIRSLLSEGRLRYETVEKTKDGLVPRLIEREGPTGLIVTTTSLRLHAENETRLLSLTITDTSAQTKAVLRALAQDADPYDVDLARWHALQVWLATGPNKVVIPFAAKLAELVPPMAIRLRRDFKTVLMLVRAHALLHQVCRETDTKGRIVATVADYSAVRALVADLVAEGVDATVKTETRDLVAAVQHLIDEGHNEVAQADLRKVLKLDKSAISRRVAAAIDGSFLRNLEERKGRPARLVAGDPLPEDQEVLPAPHRLEVPTVELHGCTVDRGDRHPSSPLGGEPADPPWEAIPALHWDEDRQAVFGERAAIKEFDGKLSRSEAEALAMRARQ